jgi:hypothetical protein
LLDLLAATAVGQIAADHDQLGACPFDQLFEAGPADLVAPRAEVQIGEM